MNIGPHFIARKKQPDWPRKTMCMPLYIHVMLALGLLMMAIFAYVFFSPYRRLQQCVNAADWPAGGVVLAQIRKLVGFNLILGIVTICVAVLGRWM